MRGMSDFDQNNLYLSDDDFMIDGSCYVQENGRYYRQEPSVSLRPEMDGALVRRRISKSQYCLMLREIKKVIAALNTEPEHD
jgi:hypothetical protein